MFYNCEVGDASYTISTGEKIAGKITLKRQYKISGDEIKEVFDTDIQIIDNILKNILSANASNKMKNIVNTIQKEQNEIIRKNDVDILIVQGPAGSGKTSIAMHKIAYLLYAERDKINNTNVMILSPNEIFNNYISDVLPEIGEDNVVQATFYEFAKSYITEFHISTKIEDVYEIVYGKKDEFSLNKFNEVKFKSDDFYTEILETFIKQNEIELMGLEPIEIQEQTVLSLDEIKQIANKIPDEGESLYLRGKKIIERNGLNYIKDEPYEVYLEILRDKKVDKKIANQILYFLVSDLSDLVEQNINSDSLLSLIQNKCDLNELAASNLVSIFQAIYSKENIKKLKNMKLKGLTLFLQENFVCEWKGLVRWQVGNIAVDCHYHAEITLMPKKNITEDDLLVWKLKNNPLMTKESIYDYFHNKQNLETLNEVLKLGLVLENTYKKEENLKLKGLSFVLTDLSSLADFVCHISLA